MRSQEDYLADLVSRAHQGDKRAYGKIFKICYKDVYDYIMRRVGNRNDAEDITMQVFALGLKGIPSFEERGQSIKAWLYRIAHNAIVSHFRKQKDLLWIDDAPDIPDAIDIADKAMRLEIADELYREITRLPTAQAEVLILRFIAERSPAETAMILDKKEATVRALQFKGLRNLKKKMQGPDSDGLIR